MNFIEWDLFAGVLRVLGNSGRTMPPSEFEPNPSDRFVGTDRAAGFV